ncbi:MAG: hypothetical protein ACK41E_11755 [Deinococcales bacterium]
MTKSEVEQLIEAAVRPLRQELEQLKARLEPLQSEPTALQNQIPTERTDFQRFLQRGLEQEQVRYSEEASEDKPAPKKGGWNPFRR